MCIRDRAIGIAPEYKYRDFNIGFGVELVRVQDDLFAFSGTNGLSIDGEVFHTLLARRIKFITLYVFNDLSGNINTCGTFNAFQSRR